MMKKKKLQPFYGFLLSSPFILLSCKKHLEIAAPENQIISNSVFANDNSARAAINGLYSQMMEAPNQFSSGGITLYSALSADELKNTVPDPQREDQFYSSSIVPNNFIVQFNLWQRGYGTIYQCNAIIEGLSAAKTVSPKIVANLTAQAKLVRAFSFFNLTNLFGEVPLCLTTNYKLNTSMPRIPLNEIYTQIATDLHSSIELFSKSEFEIITGYPSEWASRALLAKVNLYLGNWEKAIEQSTAVIHSGLFELADAPSSVFLAESPESVWSLLPVSGAFNTWEAGNFIPANAESVPRYTITEKLSSSFDGDDKRKLSWIGTNHVAGSDYLYPSKYQQVYSEPVAENYIVLRLAEMYLVSAEAKAWVDDFQGACSDLNATRERAGLIALSLNSRQDILDAVFAERQKEFFCEWGNRWFDLKRTGKADDILTALKTDWQTSDALYPIPLEQIKANPALKQNPGY